MINFLLILATKREERVPVDPCDNSNDSGLGFDHFDYPLASQPTALHFSDKEVRFVLFEFQLCRANNDNFFADLRKPCEDLLPIPLCYAQASWPEELPEVKRRRLEIKLESDDANDNFTFPDSVTHNPPRALW